MPETPLELGVRVHSQKLDRLALLTLLTSG
jgi:hypothetical protein